MELFSPATRDWFVQSFSTPTEVQRKGWPPIAEGKHTLLIAPTGSGKTLAAFLAGIDAVGRLPDAAERGVRLLYVSPLKALVYDIERNLRAPLVGVARVAARLGQPWRDLRVDVRTGDTPQKTRRQQMRQPAEVLVTTPESLFLILGSQAREGLRAVHTLIVDEVHALAGEKRGVHLALSLERLCDLTGNDPQRIGLSATVRPSDEVARFLGGERPVTVTDASTRPHLDLAVVVPVPDMESIPVEPPKTGGGPILGALYAQDAAGERRERGIWSALYPALLDEVRAHRSTLIFVNSRGLCERLARRLNELAGEEWVQAHHGSVSHAKRTEIEEALKRGHLRGIVATSSLELGIDMGAVDRVLLVESPGSAARGLQRVGRAGHRVGEVSAGRIYPKFRADLLECAVVASRMQEGEIESLRVPHNALDVLAQQIVALCCERPRAVDEIMRIVHRTYAYCGLSQDALHAVLDMLCGQFVSTEFANLRPLLRWDRASDMLSARRAAPMISRMNGGTIPDRGSYGVYLGPEGSRVGELDEEMVFETRTGDTILLGASSWRVEQITRDRVIVSPAPGEPGRLPFWHGEGPGRPFELGQALGALVRTLGAMPGQEALKYLLAYAPLEHFAAHNLVAYIAEQKAHTGTLPTDRAIVVERFRDELGDWRICILSPFGARLHAPWAMALERRLSLRGGFDVQLMYTDDGIVLRVADSDVLPELELLLPDPDEVEALVTEQLADSALFAALFRENAARALLLPRRSMDRRQPLWAQRLKAQHLLAAVKRYPRFPVLLETYRQALRDVFDLQGLKTLLAQIGRREVAVFEVETPSASPFARSLVFAYMAAYIYEQDAPLAERKAQALTLDHRLLSELLGQAELRELIDPQVLRETEAWLQHLEEGRHARDHDELHDLLRVLGDLTQDEIDLRCAGDPTTWLHRLQHERRAVKVAVAGELRWIAAQDAGLYRDALGVVPTPGLPQDCLRVPDEPLEQLAQRYAQTHGPFLAQEPAARWGLLPAQLEPVLRVLEERGIVVRGELYPGRDQLDWCHAEVLRRLKRHTLARLRHQVAAVDAQALGRFLPMWQGLIARVPGQDRLLEVITQLEGLALPWSTLSTVLLPARVAGFALDTLDMVAATGAVVWVGCGALGARDGRVALYRRTEVGRLLVPAGAYVPPSDTHRQILEHLKTRGASFLMEIEAAVQRLSPSLKRQAFETALWDLVWAGQITNDTSAPLRSLGRSRTVTGRPHRRASHVLAGGRWSLVADLMDASVTETERTLARARMLLERYGLVSREVVAFEELPGGFGPVLKVLKAMEASGQVRRGYFVEGLSGAQFGHPGAVERLRAAANDIDAEAGRGEPAALVLAAVDPANPYGALLPWPKTGATDGLRPRRVAGAWVVLLAGACVLYVGPGGRQLLTFPELLGPDDERCSAAFQALRRLPQAGRGLLVVERVDGVPVRETPHYALLKACGFEPGYRGVVAGAER